MSFPSIVKTKNLTTDIHISNVMRGEIFLFLKILPQTFVHYIQSDSEMKNILFSVPFNLKSSKNSRVGFSKGQLPDTKYTRILNEIDDIDKIYFFP